MGIHQSKVKPYISSNEEIETFTNNLIKTSNFDKYMEMNLLYKDNLESLIDSLKCYICMTNYVNLSPSCGHMGICDKCYRNKNFNYRHTCAICKKHVSYIDIILPFSEDEFKIDKINLFKIIENVDTKNIKDNLISTKIQNIKSELDSNEDLTKKFKKIKLENYHLKKQYNKINKLNDILRNKVDIRYKKSLSLKTKLIPKKSNIISKKSLSLKTKLIPKKSNYIVKDI